MLRRAPSRAVQPCARVLRSAYLTMGAARHFSILLSLLLTCSQSLCSFTIMATAAAPPGSATANNQWLRSSSLRGTSPTASGAPPGSSETLSYYTTWQAAADQHAHGTLAMLHALNVTRQPSAETSARHGLDSLLAVRMLAGQLLALEALPALLRDANVLASLRRHQPGNDRQAPEEGERQPAEPKPARPAGDGWAEPTVSETGAQISHPFGLEQPATSPCPSPPAKLMATAAPVTLDFTVVPAGLNDRGECGWLVRCASPGSVLLLNFTHLSPLANRSLRMVTGGDHRGPPR